MSNDIKQEEVMEMEIGTEPDDGRVRYHLTGDHLKRLAHWHYHGNVKDTERFKLINDKTKELAEMIMTMTPSCRNQDHALDLLEMVRMRANAAIAVDECIANGGDCG